MTCIIQIKSNNFLYNQASAMPLFRHQQSAAAAQIYLSVTQLG
jgi:hypothetical protein